MTDRLRATFILGSPFCGSTAVGNALNNAGLANYVGELCRLPQFADEFPGLGPAVCEACSAADHWCPTWNRTSVGGFSDRSLGQILEELAFGNPHRPIVEGSKDARFFTEQHRELQRRFDVRTLLLVREPLEFMNSFINAKADVGDSCGYWQAANAWRDFYSNALRSALRSGLPCLTMRTGEIRRDASMIFRIAEFSGTDLPASNPPEISFTASHQIGGNPRVQGRIGTLAPEGADRRLAMQALLDCPGAIELATTLGLPAADLYSA